MKKSHLTLYIISAAAVAAVAVAQIRQHYQTVVVDVPQFEHQVPASSTPAAQPVSPAKPQTENPPVAQPGLKSSMLLSVPFTPQAPTANWDTIHNEDCEEASSIMANAYYNGPHDAKLDPSYVEGQLTKLTTWEMQTFGYNLDVTSEETVKMIEANYGLQTKILYSFTEDDIKNELAQNHLVLFPANGQLLGNPNYKQPGPKYHMLVIRGYTPTSIITNDPGTHNGLNYSYSFDTLYKANGDWSHQTNSVDLNKKNIIVVWK
jgi:hypothetical protein